MDNNQINQIIEMIQEDPSAYGIHPERTRPTTTVSVNGKVIKPKTQLEIDEEERQRQIQIKRNRAAFERQAEQERNRIAYEKAQEIYNTPRSPGQIQSVDEYGNPVTINETMPQQNGLLNY